MLFKKKKTKLDSKVRFQHKQFTTKLDSARSYKRNVKAVPDSKVEKVFNTVGITSRWSQVLFGILLAGLLYLVYVPNFLSLQAISISGLSDTQANQLEQSIRKEIANSDFYYPNYNILFLKKDLILRAAQNVPSLDFIASVKKDLITHTIYVDAASKYEKFLVATTEQVLDIYNDGTVKDRSGVSRTDWDAHQNSNMIKVRLFGVVRFSPNDRFFREDLFSYIKGLTNRLDIVETQKLAYLTFKEPEKQNTEPKEDLFLEPVDTENQAVEDGLVQADVAEFVEVVKEASQEINLPISSSEVHAVFYKNNDVRTTYTVVFDATANAEKSLQELKLLLSQTQPDRYNQLAYIDLRIPNKAFLCLLSSPCAK